MGVRYNKEIIYKDRQISSRGPRDIQRRRANNGAQDEVVKILNERIAALSEQLQKTPASNEAGVYTADQVNAEILKAVNAETNQLKLAHERQISELNVQIIHLTNEVTSLKEKLTMSERGLELAAQEAESSAIRYANDVKAKYDNLLENRDLTIKNLIDSHKTELASLTSSIKTQDELLANLREARPNCLSEEKLKELLATISIGASSPELSSDRPQMETSFVDPLENDISSLEHKIVVEDVSTNKKDEMASKVNKLKGLMGSLPPKRPV